METEKPLSALTTPLLRWPGSGLSCAGPWGLTRSRISGAAPPSSPGLRGRAPATRNASSKNTIQRTRVLIPGGHAGMAPGQGELMNNADFVYRGLIKAGILTEGGAAATPPADTPGKSVDAQNKSKSIPDQMPRRAAVAGPPPG